MSESASQKRYTPHPRYSWLFVDTRTQPEVERTRELMPKAPISRLARRAKQLGRRLTVERDLDGAYRLFRRLDGERKAYQESAA